MNLAPDFVQQYSDNNGNPLASGYVYSYVAGTDTPLATYTSSSGGTANANPVVLDSSGRAAIWLDPTLSYKLVIKDSALVTIKTVDNIAGSAAGGIPTWNANTTYSQGNIVADGSGYGLLYVSLTNGNLNNALTVVASWRVLNGHIRTLTADTTLAVTDDLIRSNSTSASLTMTLPACSTTAVGKRIQIKDIGTGGFTTTVKGSGSDTIDGNVTYALTLSRYDSATFENNGTSWDAVDYHLSGLTTLPNLIGNSGFDISQVFGTPSASSTVTNGVSKYVLDLWYGRNALGTNGVLTVSQIAGSVLGSQYACKVQITTAPTVAQANGCELWYVFENPEMMRFYNRTVISQFQIKALGNVTQVGVEYFYATSEAKPSTANTIGSEQTFTVNSSGFTLCPLTAQAIGTSPTTAGVVGIRIRITGVSSGNTYDLNNGFTVEQAQLNIGGIMGLWTRMGRSIQEELLYCQRHYNKTLPLSVAVGAANSSPGLKMRANGTATGASNVTWGFPGMRSAPSATVYSDTTGTSGKVHGTVSGDIDGTVIAGVNSASAYNSAATSSGEYITCDITVDARI